MTGGRISHKPIFFELPRKYCEFAAGTNTEATETQRSQRNTFEFVFSAVSAPLRPPRFFVLRLRDRVRAAGRATRGAPGESRRTVRAGGTATRRSCST